MEEIVDSGQEMADLGPSAAPGLISVPTQTPETDNKECCICMRKDRKLLHLCLVNGGGNSLFSLLCDDQDDSPDGHKEPTRLIICWECDSIMSKIVRFRQQACKAQKRLSSIAEGRTMAQNAFVLIPPISGARGAGPEAILEYRSQAQADPAQPLLRVVRYGHYLYLYRFGRTRRRGHRHNPVLPDGTATPLPLPNSSSHQSSLLELLEGINQ